MEIRADIVIIGEGLAGFAAALELQGSQKEVCVLSRSPGRSALNGGAWDVADHPLRRTQDSWDSCLDLGENLEEQCRQSEFHPYALLKEAAPVGAFSEFLLDLCSRAARELPLPFSLSDGTNRLYLTSFGTLRPAAFVQASMAQGAISSLEEAKVLVAGIRGFPAFSSRFISQALLEMQASQAKDYVSFSGSFDMELAGISAASLDSFALAAHLDREEHFVDFAKRLVEYLQGKVYTHVLLPPVMGIKNTANILAAITKITGMRAAETLSASGGVPGFRLQTAIRESLDRNGVRRLAGEALGFEHDGARVKSLRVVSEKQEYSLQADAFILASGKYLGGGIARHQAFREPLFDLPVFHQKKALRDESIVALSRPEAGESQPFLSAGVAVNAQCQALDEQRGPAYDNLFAAGSVLMGFDPAHDRCAEGIAILSGTIAARSVLQVLG